MHVLHVINSLDVRSGGPIYALRGLLQWQLEHGYRVSLIATDMQAGVGGLSREEHMRRNTEDELSSRHKPVVVKAYGRGRPFNHLGFAPGSHAALSECLRTRDVSLIHIHGVFGWLTSAAAAMASRFGIPYVIEPYGAYDPSCFRSHLSFLKWLYHKLWGSKELSGAAAIRVASDHEAAPFISIDHLRKKVVTIPYGVDLPSSDVVNNREKSCDGEAGPVCYMSRIAKKKRPEWVVLAAEMVKREFPRLNVEIVGSDDGHRSQLERVIAERNCHSWVRVRDFVYGEEKAALLNSASMLVLPSRDESLGAVVLEAMAHAVPVVVTPGVASHVYVDEARCGFTVEDSVEGVAEGIRRVLLSDRQELGRRGRQYVEKHLTWPVVAQQIDQVYRSVVTNHEQSA